MKSKYTCYFCQDPVELFDSYHRRCSACSKLPNIKEVFHTFLPTGERRYAHIYTFLGDKHIRLEFLKNQTHIGDQYNIIPSIIIPGFPINTDNVYEKIKLYLTFS